MARRQSLAAGTGAAAGLQAADLAFLVALAAGGSLSATARELNLSKAAVSKRLALLEARVGLPLVSRSTRRMGFTPEGEAVLERARVIVAEIDELSQLLARDRSAPQGLLRVNATLGFGRSHVAPVVSRFARRHPGVEVQLQLTVNPPLVSDDAFDVCIRFGEPPDARVVARHLAANRRLLCAAPAYLERCGVPRTPRELARHACIGIRQGGEAYGTWRLAQGQGARRRTEVVKTRGALATNDGEVAVQWALDGHGIVMRAEWDVARHLERGRLVAVLPEWETPDASVYAVYPERLRLAPRVRAFVDFIADSFGARAPSADPATAAAPPAARARRPASSRAGG